MRFDQFGKEHDQFGKEHDQVIILLHGGGLGSWQYYQVAQQLQSHYRVIVPQLNGHQGSDKPFTNIQDTAQDLLDLIDDQFDGQVLAMAGLSLGGQILLESLALRPDCCQFALLESVNVLPIRFPQSLLRLILSASYPLTQYKWFARLQFQNYRFESSYFEAYFQASSAIKKEDLINLTLASLSYKPNPKRASCPAKTLILAGDRESKSVKNSLNLLTHQIPHAQDLLLPQLSHGQFSLNQPEGYVEKLLELIGH